MADAGRILIIPKGDYNANSTYDKLDLVKYKGTSWLAKKATTGNEPSEENSEWWQNMFGFNIADNLTTTAEGMALDARQGKILDDKISVNTEQTNKLDNKIIEINNHLSLRQLTITPSSGVTINTTASNSYVYGNIAIIHIRSITIPSGTAIHSVLATFDLPSSFAQIMVHEHNVIFTEKKLVANKTFTSDTTIIDIHLVIPLI